MSKVTPMTLKTRMTMSKVTPMRLKKRMTISMWIRIYDNVDLLIAAVVVSDNRGRR